MKLIVLCLLLSDTKASLRNSDSGVMRLINIGLFRAHGPRDDLTSHHNRNPDDRL